MHQSENKMGTQPVVPLLVSMAIPPMVSMFIQSMYNVVDGMFVARISEDALTAVSLAFPIQNLILAVGVGSGVGCNARIARKLGEKRQEEADSTVTHGMLLAGIWAIFFLLLGLFGTAPFFRMFTDSAEIFAMGCDYTYIVTFFGGGLLLHVAVEKILQATGNMIYPMLFQAVGAIINIILDPIFIFGYFGLPAMGVRGAAIATIIGQWSAMSMAVIMFLKGKHAVKVQTKGFRLSLATIKEIYSVGVPSILLTALGSVLVMGLNAILITFSNLAVSVFGVYYKLQTFVFMPESGLMQGAMPIMAYNYGAGDQPRLRKAFRASLGFSLAIMAIGCLVFELLPEQLMQMFQASPQMMEMGVVALRVISLSYLPAAFGYFFTTYFQSVGMGRYSLALSLMRQLVGILPLAYLLYRPFGLMGIWITFPIAEGVTALLSWAFYQKEKQNILNHSPALLQE